MFAILSTIIGTLVGGALVVFAVLAVIGLPLALFEAVFGRSGSSPRLGDRSADELYEWRTRDQHRR